MNNTYHENDIKQWGIDRNLIGPTGQATPETQVSKLREEVDEIAEEVEKRDRDALRLEIGDAFVVLCQIAAMWNMTVEECAEAAWHKIKDRKGMMLGGKFVKEENLNALKLAGFSAYQGRMSIQVAKPDERDAAISVANANGLEPRSQWFAQLGCWEVSV